MRNILNVIEAIKDEPVINKIKKLAIEEGVSIYLVGGFIRDIILSRKKKFIDYDFSVSRDAIGFARKLALGLRAGFVVLDEAHGSCRVIINRDNYITLDFTDFRGKSIFEDLKHRDFTINSLCLDIQNLNREGAFYDPLNGLSDIKNKIIRQANPLSIAEDPVRILRAFSLSAIFKFKITSDTRLAIKKNLGLLRSSAFERIREELFKIIETDQSFGIIRELDEAKILKILIPEVVVCYNVDQGPYHHLDVWEHSLTTLNELEKLLNLTKSPVIKEYLDEEIAQGHKRIQLIKLAALLHDIGKPKAKRQLKGKLIFHGHERTGSKMIPEIAARLKLSGKETDYLRRIIWMHLRPGYLADLEPLSERAVFSFFRDAHREVLDILLVSLADQRATRGPLNTSKSRENHEKLCAKLIKRFFAERKQKPFKRIINGNDLKSIGVPESPIMGKILKELEELQAEGKIKSKKQARTFAKKFLANLSLKKR